MLDYDSQWADVRGYHFYDFNAPEDVPSALHHGFDMVRALAFSLTLFSIFLDCFVVAFLVVQIDIFPTTYVSWKYLDRSPDKFSMHSS